MDTLLSLDTYLTLLINGSDSIWLDHFALLCTKTWVWSPLFLAIIYTFICNVRRPTLWYLIVGAILCVLVSDQVSSSIVKPLVCRLRPSHEPSISNLIDIAEGYRGGLYGFFSSHAANTMSVAVFISLVIRQRLTTTALFFWSLFNCWTRLYLGVHYVGDILVGLIFGALVGYVMYRLVNNVLLRFDDNESSEGCCITKVAMPKFPISVSYRILNITLCVPIFAIIYTMFQ